MHRGRVIENESDFGDIAGRAIRGAAKNNVVHLAAAHLLGRRLAHHPFQCFDDIGLAATVWPDNARNTVFDLDFDRIEEGFKTAET